MIAIPSLVWTIGGIVFNVIGVILLFLFGMPFHVRRHGQQFLKLGQLDPEDQDVERRYDVLGWVALVIIITGAAMQIVGAINIHFQFLSAVFPIPTMETLSPALTTIAAVGAVVWTGGLIVLQLRATASSGPVPARGAGFAARSGIIQAGMACAAFGFLVPLVLLMFSGLLLHIVFTIGQ